MANHPETPKRSPLMARVAQAIQERGLSLKDAARSIKVTPDTLERHLAGEHVRSDSRHKYEDWLGGRVATRNVFVLPSREPARAVSNQTDSLSPPPPNPYLVVDIFSGCGGLSLGFDLLGQGSYFKTVLAIDNQTAPVEAFNRNTVAKSAAPIARVADLTDFINEIEFLTYYIVHTASVHDDRKLQARLDALCGGIFPNFLSQIEAANETYVSELRRIRNQPAWQVALDSLDRQALSQTSVIAFHEKLRLPRIVAKLSLLPDTLWSGMASPTVPPNPGKAHLLAAEQEWDSEVSQLKTKTKGNGRGQLSASARRVQSFVDFVRSPAMVKVRHAWINWRAAHLSARACIFGSKSDYAEKIRALYSESYPVSVLVGGPPCQGFSRIGRGKIRSLRDALVQVHGHEEAGDARNLLFLQYVMVLSALKPQIFLFENVQHFQSTVRSNGREFQATEVLADAIGDISNGKLHYEVSSRIIDASKHGVPQTRRRYFMCGINAGAIDLPENVSASACLALQEMPEVQLSYALEGLPPPILVGGDGSIKDENKFVIVQPTPDKHPYVEWIRQRPPRGDGSNDRVDAQVARRPRLDDAAWFSLMGPGKRWMDYRADDAETLRSLRSVVAFVAALPGEAISSRKVGAPLALKQTAKDLLNALDGSLPLRLMLEQISAKLEIPHHLLADAYLKKREGNHGDWTARMDAARPAKTMVSHMGKDTYAYVHPFEPRTISLREAARIQTFPDWFRFGGMALTDGFKMIGNAVPPLLSHAIARQAAKQLNAIRSLRSSKIHNRAPKAREKLGS